MKIYIYTKKNCSYCSRAKSLLISKNLEFHEISIDEDYEKQKEMINLSGGIATVPQIFINNNHIGGFYDLYKLNSKGYFDK